MLIINKKNNTAAYQYGFVEVILRRFFYMSCLSAQNILFVYSTHFHGKSQDLTGMVDYYRGKTKNIFLVFCFRQYLCNSSLTTLIKKGRGIWPVEALATCFDPSEKGANSITLEIA